jgi:hypothetical protein
MGFVVAHQLDMNFICDPHNFLAYGLKWNILSNHSKGYKISKLLKETVVTKKQKHDQVLW